MAISSQFLSELLNKLPAEDRGTAEAIFTKAEAADAVRFADNGARRQADYSRSMDEVRTQQEQVAAAEAQIQTIHQQQTAWWEANQPLVEAGRKAIAAGGTPTMPITNELPPNVVTRDDMEKLINEREAGAAAYFAVANSLAIEHFRQFGETLDLSAVQSHAIKHRLDLPTAYKTLHAEPLKAKADAAEQARIDKLVEEKLTVERRAFSQRQPFPVPGGEESPLAALATPEADRSQYSADAAAQEYLSLVAKRG